MTGSLKQEMLIYLLVFLMILGLAKPSKPCCSVDVWDNVVHIKVSISMLDAKKVKRCGDLTSAPQKENCGKKIVYKIRRRNLL